MEHATSSGAEPAVGEDLAARSDHLRVPDETQAAERASVCGGQPLK
jgi:hypothetical protein